MEELCDGGGIILRDDFIAPRFWHRNNIINILNIYIYIYRVRGMGIQYWCRTVLEIQKSNFPKLEDKHQRSSIGKSRCQRWRESGYNCRSSQLLHNTTLKETSLAFKSRTLRMLASSRCSMIMQRPPWQDDRYKVPNRNTINLPPLRKNNFRNLSKKY